MPNMTIGEKIQREASIQGYNIRQLALNAGVNYTTLYAIIKRKSQRVNANTLKRIADVLNVTPEYFLDNIENKIELTEAEIVVFETINGICGASLGTDRDNMLYLINDFLETNQTFLINVHNKLSEKGE